MTDLPMGSHGVAPRERLHSLDAYRGWVMFFLAAGELGISAALLVNFFPDSFFLQALAAQSTHVRWAGCHAWDMIQPSFMFIVGVSLAYSYRSRQGRGQGFRRMFGHAVYRAIVLVLLGVFLRSGHGTQTHWTFEDVLTQIGLGYVFLFLLWDRGWKMQAGAAAAILVGYWALWRFWPQIAPLFGAANPVAGWHEAAQPGWPAEGNPGQAFDLWLRNLLPHEHAFTNWPYYTLNFIPSLATMIFGLMAGHLLQSDKSNERKVLTLLGAGAAGIVLGYALDWSGACPIVKKIWTPSWTLFSGGWCLLLLGEMFWIVDVWRWRRWAFPAVVLGMNSIGVYVLVHYWHGWLPKVLSIHLDYWLLELVSPAWATLIRTLLAFALLWLVFFWMYRRRIFLRI